MGFLKILLHLIGLFIIAILLVTFGSYYLKEYQIKKEEKQREIMYTQILEAAHTAPIKLSVDYTKPIGTGSPLIFGGSHTPPEEHTGIWDQLTDIGITSIRKDLYVEFSLPRNITIGDYINNVNDIKNVKNWDQNTITSIKTALKNAKDKNMKTIGIMAYAPKWLTHNNSPHGVPENWDVYKDIIKKIYTLYRDDLDYIEIWNEPDHNTFLITDNSGLSKAEAYNLIYAYATDAIREVDAEINDGKVTPIGAAVESNPRVSNILETLIEDPNLKIKPNFLSFHTYDSFEDSLQIYNNIKEKNLESQTPIFITEWNMESKSFDPSEYKIGNKAILFTGNTFIEYFKNNIFGANYFALLPINTSNRNTNDDTMGFYRWVNNEVELLPQARSWRLLSKKMGLGVGSSKIYDVKQDTDTFNSLGFINSSGQKGIVLINPYTKGEIVSLNFNNTQIKDFAKIIVYYASTENDAKNPDYEAEIKVKKGNFDFIVSVPQESIVGVLLVENTQWYNFLKFTK